NPQCSRPASFLTSRYLASSTFRASPRVAPVGLVARYFPIVTMSSSVVLTGSATCTPILIRGNHKTHISQVKGLSEGIRRGGRRSRRCRSISFEAEPRRDQIGPPIEVGRRDFHAVEDGAGRHVPRAALGEVQYVVVRPDVQALRVEDGEAERAARRLPADRQAEAPLLREAGLERAPPVEDGVPEALAGTLQQRGRGKVGAPRAA